MMKYRKLNNRQKIIKFKADMMSVDNAYPARLWLVGIDIEKTYKTS